MRQGVCAEQACGVTIPRVPHHRCFNLNHPPSTLMEAGRDVKIDVNTGCALGLVVEGYGCKRGNVWCSHLDPTVASLLTYSNRNAAHSIKRGP